MSILKKIASDVDMFQLGGRNWCRIIMVVGKTSRPAMYLGLGTSALQLCTAESIHEPSKTRMTKDASILGLGDSARKANGHDWSEHPALKPNVASLLVWFETSLDRTRRAGYCSGGPQLSELLRSGKGGVDRLPGYSNIQSSAGLAVKRECYAKQKRTGVLH